MKVTEARENVKKANKDVSLFYKKHKVYLINHIDDSIKNDSSEGLSETTTTFEELFHVLNKVIYPQMVFDLFNRNTMSSIFFNNIKKHYEKLGYNVVKNDDEFSINWEDINENRD